MSTKEKIINILDILPEDVIKSIYDYTQYLAYQNEDVLTDEEIKSLNTAMEDMQNGKYITHEELLKELGYKENIAL